MQRRVHPALDEFGTWFELRMDGEEELAVIDPAPAEEFGPVEEVDNFAAAALASDDLRRSGYLRADGSEDWTLSVGDDCEPTVAYALRTDVLMMAMFLGLTGSHLSPLHSAFTRHGMLIELAELLLLACGQLPNMDLSACSRLRGSLTVIMDAYMDAEVGYQLGRMADDDLVGFRAPGTPPLATPSWT